MMDGRDRMKRFVVALTATVSSSRYLREQRAAARRDLDRADLTALEFIRGAMHWQLAVLEQTDALTARSDTSLSPDRGSDDWVIPPADNSASGQSCNGDDWGNCQHRRPAITRILISAVPLTSQYSVSNDDIGRKLLDGLSPLPIQRRLEPVPA